MNENQTEELNPITNTEVADAPVEIADAIIEIADAIIEIADAIIEYPLEVSTVPVPELISNGKKPKKSKAPRTPESIPVETVTGESVCFADLPLSPEVQQAVQLSGYQHPTPIQAEIIPLLLAGRDVLAQSQTGTGKTAAFALPILTRIETECRTPQVLVLVPTRELAIQVAKSFMTYGSQLEGFQHAVIYGGQDYEIQYKQLRRGPQVVVGTPGRVIDHIKKGTLKISEIECLVLDEADEMLNMGFLEDVQFVLENAPEHRQIALFSATLPPPIRTIAQRYLKDPAKVTIRKKTMTADLIRQRAVFVAPRDKVDLLIRFIEAENTDGVLVFMRTRETTTVVAEKLIRAGLRAVALNGEMPQRTRERTIQRLKAGQLDILVATDVAARGLDLSRISHVFNFDFPEGPDAYIHRVGRTGRAGRTGEAIIFLSPSQRSRLRFIENATRQPIEIVEAPSIQQINATRMKKFFDSIDDTIANRDMKFFQKMVGDYAQQSGQPMEVIAAAIAMIGQNGRDFQMKDRPERQERQERERYDDSKSAKHKTGDRGRNGKRDDRRESFGGPPEPGMTRYRIAIGKRDGVRPGNIVGAITNEAGIEGEEIGAIRIHDSFSTIDLPKDKAVEIVDQLNDTRVSGRPMNLTLADEKEDRSSGEGRNRHYKSASGGYGEKPQYGKRNENRKKESHWQKTKRSGNRSLSKGKGEGPNASNSFSKGKSDGPNTSSSFGKSRSTGPNVKKTGREKGECGWQINSNRWDLTQFSAAK